MPEVYVSCGVWRSFNNAEWRFIADEEKRGGRLVTLESSTTLEELKMSVSEDYGVESTTVDVEFSYLPADLVSNSKCQPILISNDRQLRNLVGYLRKKVVISLCVTFKASGDERGSRVDIDLNEDPHDSSDEDDVRNFCKKSAECVNESKQNDDFKSNPKAAEVGCDDGLLSENIDGKQCESHWLAGSFKKDQLFTSKGVLKANLEICAMKYNFDYRVTKSDTTIWSIRCKERACKWGVRAECLKGSTYFKINKFVAEHRCAPSQKNKFGRTASAKTIGNLIMHKYVGIGEGPKPNDIINIMRTEHGCELSYNQAWESREYAVNAVRGIPEKSFCKIPKYLHMLEEANPGTHTSYQIDCDGKFKYLFISFGQSVRGFYKAMRRVIVVDGTFLKSKYKGVMLVATAVDGNSNLYPIAFGIADSENESSWEWFFMQLKVVIVDEQCLAFVSDRHSAIGKTLGKVYPLARHGICIHHLLTNVVTYFKAKGLAGLVEKASKAYRVADFEKYYNQICMCSPLIGKYLEEADMTKWARSLFPGFRFDIRTTNPAESINSALRAPREYPIIPLLDSIREMLTRWFFERRALSADHKHPLTIEVEDKISKRIEKAKTLVAYPITVNRFQVKGDRFDCVVDLERKTCTCRKFDLGKIPCRHAIKAAFSMKKKLEPLADEVYSTTVWRSAYQESINPILVPEDEWRVPKNVEDANVLPPYTRKRPGRQKKRRYETVEDKLRSSQGSKHHKCSRCGNGGHNRATCSIPI